MHETAILIPGPVDKGRASQGANGTAWPPPPRSKPFGGDLLRGGSPQGIGHAGKALRHRPLLHMVLSLVAALCILGTCSNPAYAATIITFPNGDSATLNADGSIEGTCMSQRSPDFALYRDGDPNDPGPGVPTPFHITMPDGQSITAYCQDGENYAPRDGSIPFTAYVDGNSYSVWIWGNRVGVNTAEVAAWSAAGRGLYYPAQRLYASYWKPSIQGDITLSKTSSGLEITSNNASYSLEGAVYGIYSDSACTKEVARITTDASGHAKSDKLDAGTYWIKEIEPSTGFALDLEVHKADIAAGKTTNVSVSEEPQVHPIALLLTKVDADLHEAIPQGNASLEGARFLVRLFGNTAGDTSGNPLRTWIFASDAQGRVVMDEEHLVSGDGFFTDASGAIVLPLGTLSLKEISAPQTYYLEGQASSSGGLSEAPAHTLVFSSNGTSATIEGYEPITVEEQVKRGGLSLDKDDGQTVSAQGDAHLDGVVFEIVNRSEHDVMVGGTRFSPGEVVTTLVTDADGCASTEHDLLPLGTYEVREAEPGEGYLNTSEAQMVVIDAPDTVFAVETHFTDTVMRGGLRVGKVSSETADPVAQGGASLAGTRFSVTSVSAAPVLVDGVLYRPGSIVAVLTTDEQGRAELAAEALPYGSYEIREIEAPQGYLLNEEWSQTITICEEGAVADISAPEHAAPDRVKRGGFSFNKADEASMEAMPGTVFLVTALDDPDGDGIFESHIIVTDENGIFDSEYARHSTLTNANDAAYDPVTGVLDESLLDHEAGLWFSGRSDTSTAPDDARGALPYGSYTAQELACSANEGHRLVCFTLHIARNGHTVDRGTIDDKLGPQLATELGSEAGKVVPATGDPVILTDRVQYANLEVGKTYRVAGELVAAESGSSLGITSSKEFTAYAESGFIELEFVLDPSVVEGEAVVAFEDLWLSDSCVATHKDLDDEGQTVLIPSISTTLADSEGSTFVSSADDTITLLDTVSYRGLWPGESYRAQGELYDKVSGESLGICAATSFIAEDPEGVIEVVFEVPATLLAGRTVVCFETLLRNELPIAVHADFEDRAQTAMIPAIGTVLVSASGEKEPGDAEDTVALTDMVSYRGLLPGEDYRIVSSLIDKKSGEVLLGRQELSFSAEDFEGAVEVMLSLDAAQLSGREIVAFEELYYENVLLARHADVEDEDQTVRFAQIRTSLADVDGRRGVIRASSPTVLVDTVSYSGLAPGKSYLLRGSLMDKATGEPVGIDAEAVFIAEQAEGTAEVAFVCDSTLIAGKDVVAFETLMQEGRELVVHADLDDESQTVSVPRIATLLAEANGNRKTVEKGAFTLVDTVSYTNLEPGETYTVRGLLVDKATGTPFLGADGAPVCGETSFVAEAESGSCTVSFSVDASQISEHTQLVAFEAVRIEDGTVLATHEDLDDEMQTVSVTVPDEPQRTFVPGTGDDNNPLSMGAAAATGAVLAVVSTFVGMRTESSGRSRIGRRKPKR